jgi:hypothetical protein
MPTLPTSPNVRITENAAEIKPGEGRTISNARLSAKPLQ